jgi:hypothetical protein
MVTCDYRANVLVKKSQVGKLQISDVDDHLLVPLKALLHSRGDSFEDGRVITLRSFFINGHQIQSQESCPPSRNSYTVEFKELNDSCYGFIKVIIKHQRNFYAIVQRVIIEDWSVCPIEEDHVSDITKDYGDLQSLLGNDIMPAHETESYVAIDITAITAKLTCINMDGSSGIFLAKLPNVIECD